MLAKCLIFFSFLSFGYVGILAFYIFYWFSSAILLVCSPYHLQKCFDLESILPNFVCLGFNGWLQRFCTHQLKILYKFSVIFVLFCSTLHIYSRRKMATKYVSQVEVSRGSDSMSGTKKKRNNFARVSFSNRFVVQQIPLARGWRERKVSAVRSISI